MKSEKPTVAVVNSNEEIIEGLQLLLTDMGYPSVTGHVISFKRGKEDFIKFLKENDPRVIIIDIAPPYEENWRFFKLLKNLKESEGRSFIITTTNKHMLEELVGPTKTHEIVGKPFDMKEIVDAVDQTWKRKLAHKK
jgi:DNA-binding NtrC family response regulator